MKKSDIRKKNINKKSRIILICLLIIFLLPIIATFGRYTINSVNNFFIKSQEFYFNSDKLGTNNPVFLIDNWSGVDDYTIDIVMNSRKNIILGATYDIDYDISFNSTNNAIVTISKTSGIIKSNTNSDNLSIHIVPNKQMGTGEEVVINVTATAKSPYKKTITGKFILRVGKENITYKVEDSVNSHFLKVNITNTRSYYLVDKAFGNKKVGDRINIQEYLALQSVDKEKCHSGIITIGFDPNKVQMDMTNENFAKATNIKTTNLNGYKYVNEITFKIDAISSSTVRLYKTDIKKDYTNVPTIVSVNMK